MNKQIFQVGLLFCTVLAGISQDDEEPANHQLKQQDLEKAQRVSSETSKPILVYFYDNY